MTGVPETTVSFVLPLVMEPTKVVPPLTRNAIVSGSSNVIVQLVPLALYDELAAIRQGGTDGGVA